MSESIPTARRSLLPRACRDIRSKARANIAKHYAAKERVDREHLRSLKIEAERYARTVTRFRPPSAWSSMSLIRFGLLAWMNVSKRPPPGRPRGEALKFDDKATYEEIMNLRENDPQAFADFEPAHVHGSVPCRNHPNA